MIRFFPAWREHAQAAAKLLSMQLREHRIPVEAKALSRVVRGAIADRRLGSVVLAADGDAIVGVSYLAYTWTMEHGGKSAWLEEMYVLPERRDGGIGRRLLRETLALARRQGCVAVDLEVEASHRRVESLYRRNRFKPHRRRRWFKKIQGAQ